MISCSQSGKHLIKEHEEVKQGEPHLLKTLGTVTEEMGEK